MIRADEISPASIEGGTWTKIAQGRAIIGASTDYPLNSTGGEATHTLTVAEMPNIRGEIAEIAVQDRNQVPLGGLYTSGVFSGRQLGSYVGYGTSMYWTSDMTEGGYTQPCNDSVALNFGGNQPHNNMQPYLALNIWQKIAD